MQQWLVLLRDLSWALGDVSWVFALLGGTALIAAPRHPRATTAAWIAILVLTGWVFDHALHALVALHDDPVQDPMLQMTLESRAHTRVMMVPVLSALATAPGDGLALLLALPRGRWQWRGEFAVIPVVAAIPLAWERFVGFNSAGGTEHWRAGLYLLSGVILVRAPEDRRLLEAAAWGVAVVAGELGTLALAQQIGTLGCATADPAVVARLLEPAAFIAVRDLGLVLLSTMLAFVPFLHLRGVRALPLLVAGLFGVLACNFGVYWRYVVWPGSQ